MLEDTGFIAREEGDEFLVLTCPECHRDIIFTQRVDPVVIRESTHTHADHCSGWGRVHRSRVAETVVAGR